MKDIFEFLVVLLYGFVVEVSEFQCMLMLDHWIWKWRKLWLAVKFIRIHLWFSNGEIGLCSFLSENSNYG